MTYRQLDPQSVRLQNSTEIEYLEFLPPMESSPAHHTKIILTAVNLFFARETTVAYVLML